MKQSFLKAFTPSEDNQGIPILLQGSGVVVIMVLAFVVFALSTLHGQIVKNYAGETYAAVIAAVLIDQSNDERADLGLPELRPSAELTASAQLKADDMATREYFAHTSPTGLSPWHWFEQVGYSFSFAGENLAVNFRDSGSVTRAWMNSPTHRDNIVSENFEEIGIATAVGRYKGRRSTFVAQHFAAPYQSPDVFDEFSGITTQTSNDEVDQAIDEANQLLAAVNNVGVIDRVMVQPNKVYLAIYLVMLLLVAAVTMNAYVKSDSRSHQKMILTYGGMVAIVIVSLGLASLQILDTEVIAGVEFIALQ